MSHISPAKIAKLQKKLKVWLSRSLPPRKPDSNIDTTGLEKEIDKLVYELYNLTEDEIMIVEGSV